MPNSVFPNFPYDRRFNKHEIAEITERSERLADHMRDPMAPTGMPMGIPEDYLRLLSVHCALAGLDTHTDERQYIVAKKLPDETGRYADSVEWVLKTDATPEVEQSLIEAEAQKYADAMETQLTPEVRAAIIERLTREAT